MPAPTASQLGPDTLDARAPGLGKRGALLGRGALEGGDAGPGAAPAVLGRAAAAVLERDVVPRFSLFFWVRYPFKTQPGAKNGVSLFRYTPILNLWDPRVLLISSRKPWFLPTDGLQGVRFV